MLAKTAEKGQREILIQELIRLIIFLLEMRSSGIQYQALQMQPNWIRYLLLGWVYYFQVNAGVTILMSVIEGQ